jgi:hypothetical protein
MSNYTTPKIKSAYNKVKVLFSAYKKSESTENKELILLSQQLIELLLRENIKLHKQQILSEYFDIQPKR